MTLRGAYLASTGSLKPVSYQMDENGGGWSCMELMIPVQQHGPHQRLKNSPVVGIFGWVMPVGEYGKLLTADENPRTDGEIM